MPPTTGGSTSGSSTSERSTPWPGNVVRASTIAIGIPNSTQSRVLTADVRRLSQSASFDASDVISRAKSDQSTRATIATSGSSRKRRPERPPGRRSSGGSTARVPQAPKSARIPWPVSPSDQLDELLGEVGLVGPSTVAIG